MLHIIGSAWFGLFSGFDRMYTVGCIGALLNKRIQETTGEYGVQEVLLSTVGGEKQASVR
jgi:hypothetical protein